MPRQNSPRVFDIKRSLEKALAKVAQNRRRADESRYNEDSEPVKLTEKNQLKQERHDDAESNPPLRSFDALFRTDLRVKPSPPVFLSDEIGARVTTPNDEQEQNGPLHAVGLVVNSIQIKRKVSEIKKPEQTRHQFTEMQEQLRSVIAPRGQKIVSKKRKKRSDDQFKLIATGKKIDDRAEPRDTKQGVTFLGFIRKRKQNRRELLSHRQRQARAQKKHPDPSALDDHEY